jgi:site-specific recombinase XerD
MTESRLPSTILQSSSELVVREQLPRSIIAAGPAAEFAWDEFFAGMIRNKHTRTAYLRAVKQFLTWIELQQVELVRITPGMVGHYLDQMELSTPSKKLHLSAIKGYLDVMVQRHVIVLNPAHSVRTERYSALEGKTPEISVAQARQLLDSIKIKSVVDLRDKAIIGVLIYTAARAGAVAKLKLRDLQNEGTQYVLRFNEKGGKSRALPVRHDLQRMLEEYQLAALLEGQAKDSPLFRSASGKSRLLTNKSMTAIDICRMVKRRLVAAGMQTSYSPHSFRSCTATDLLLQGVPLEDVQYLLGHADPRVTRLYDRRQKQVTRNIVERISV